MALERRNKWFGEHALDLCRVQRADAFSALRMDLSFYGSALDLLTARVGGLKVHVAGQRFSVRVSGSPKCRFPCHVRLTHTRATESHQTFYVKPHIGFSHSD